MTVLIAGNLARISIDDSHGCLSPRERALNRQFGSVGLLCNEGSPQGVPWECEKKLLDDV